MKSEQIGKRKHTEDSTQRNLAGHMAAMRSLKSLTIANALVGVSKSVLLYTIFFDVSPDFGKFNNLKCQNMSLILPRENCCTEILPGDENQI